MTMDKLFDGSDAHLLPGNAELIQRLNEPELYYPDNFDTPRRANALLSGLCQEAADAIESADKRIAGLEEAASFNFEQYQDAAFRLCEANQRIAEERETHDRMMEEGAEKLFAAESEYKAMANLAAAYLRDKQEAEKRIAELEALLLAQPFKNEREKEAERKLAVAREALNAMLTHMGMDEDEWNKPTFDQAREALAQIGGDDAR